jgi:peptidoglycan-associated lipoprotein
MEERMKGIRLVAATAVMFALPACSVFSSGSDDADLYGDGNIPLATAGDELSDVNFEFDSSVLDEDARAKLDENASWLSDNPETKVVVEGHCDERGTNEYNLALGERRAQSVFSYLRTAGVSAEQMSTISYGEELPLDDGHSESAWAKNRRAHFQVSQ